MTKLECPPRRRRSFLHSRFVIRISFVIRPSSFVIAVAPRMLERLLHRLDRHRWLTLGVVLIAALAAGWHLPGLRVLDSPERWMPRTTQDAWRVVERHFDIGDNIGIGLHFHRPLSEADLLLMKGLRQRLE